MLHKVGVEDNVSYYGNRGAQDFILNIVWNGKFHTKKANPFISHLSGSKLPEVKNTPTEENEVKTVTIDDCFDEFKKSEMLDENNMWYCNKCKDHV
mgnify:CR=1 FL=1|jgi:hypothetical protein